MLRFNPQVTTKDVCVPPLPSHSSQKEQVRHNFLAQDNKLLLISREKHLAQGGITNSKGLSCHSSNQHTIILFLQC